MKDKDLKQAIEEQKKPSEPSALPTRRVIPNGVLVKVPDTLSLMDSAKGLIAYGFDSLQSKAIKGEEFTPAEDMKFRRLVQSLLDIASLEIEQGKLSNLDKIGDKELFDLVITAIPTVAANNEDEESLLKIIELALKKIDEAKAKEKPDV